MSNYRGRPVANKEPPQPDYLKDPPKRIKTTGRRDGVMYVAGNGNENPDVMFCMTSLLEEDSVEERYASFDGGQTLKEPPQYCKGLCGGILRDLIDRSGMDATSVWYTSVIKWLLPRNKRSKPSKEALNFAMPSFMDEIRRMKPKLVVCMGKQVFDLFCPYKLKADDIKLGVMYHEELGVHYVLVDPMHLLSMRPDFVEKMAMELQEVATFVKQLRGHTIPRIETSYQYLRTREQVWEWMSTTARNYALFAVDCEWGGNTFVDGTLRTIQFSWLPGTGVAIVFRDEKGDYVMDASYEEIGALLGDHMNHPNVKYVGHHWSADSVWMRHWLKLETYQKCVLDTEFAQQVLYEHVDMGLENLTMLYTDMGKYDLDLVIWKKLHPLKDGDGYAYIPDDILLPYACKDTDATLRIALTLHNKLVEDGTWEYYRTIFNPFVTDVFTEFAYNGLPVDVPQLDELRDLYMFVREKLESKFRHNIHQEAKELFVKECVELSASVDMEVPTIVSWVVGLLSDNHESVVNEIKTVLGAKLWPSFMPFVQHLQASSEFNLRSSTAMKRWLFDVKRITPIKSTNRKDQG
jgi:hypothetical protein